MSVSSTLQLNILSSYCWIDPDSQNNAAKEQLSSIADFGEISLQQIPPIKRRRLNGLSKLAMHTSLGCLEDSGIEPSQPLTVFGSQHGELNRTVSIVEGMLKDHEVSPKDFSLSVHNATLGLYSIFSKNKQPGTSIAAESNTFGYALVESYNLLQRFPDSKVLLTCFDMEVGQPFAELQRKGYPGYSLSLLLANESEHKNKLAFNFEFTERQRTPELPLALEFFKFWHSDSSKQTLCSLNTDWNFSKNVL